MNFYYCASYTKSKIHTIMVFIGQICKYFYKILQKHYSFSEICSIIYNTDNDTMNLFKGGKYEHTRNKAVNEIQVHIRNSYESYFLCPCFLREGRAA